MTILWQCGGAETHRSRSVQGSNAGEGHLEIFEQRNMTYGARAGTIPYGNEADLKQLVDRLLDGNKDGQLIVARR